MPIDLYCERLDPSFWAEPVNAISNVAFVMAAIYGIWLVRRRGGMDGFEGIVLLLALLIGPGSFLFHTFANAWSERADVIPIWSFVAAYVAVSIFRATGENRAKTLRIILITLVITGGAIYATTGDVTTDPHGHNHGTGILNGSLQYLPALVALIAFAALALWRGHPMRGWIVGAAGCFVLSLGFRTVDLSVCGAFPLGSHFMWHVLNGAMVGILLRVMILGAPPVAFLQRA